MSECVYGCQKDGTPCPRPHTCHTIGMQKAIDEQARTDRQEAHCCTGNCRQGRDCTRASYGMLDVVKDVALLLSLIALAAIIGGGLSGFFYELFRG